ncbi:MAG TPA: AIPR family protein [Anaerohalosphaeraceae bacterium]|nr:AIPR family protein [Anaerohalosphaeraceae bacterium]
MTSSTKYPKEFRVPVEQEHIRSIKSPYAEELSIIHAFVKIKNFQNGDIPDKINPRYHDINKMKGRVPDAIQESLVERPRLFHLLNRGCLILAQKAWYDNKSKILHFVIDSEEQHGMVDGATTDRVLKNVKISVSNADFYTLTEEEIPENLKDAYLHLEIISGPIDDELRLKLADARNTSEQVKEFSLEDLGGGFKWLKDVLENSEFRGKVRYRENEPKPFDVRNVLALLTLFHCNWEKVEKDPIVAYTGKGAVLDIYKDERKDSLNWREKYELLAPVVVDILKLYEYIHVGFKKQYEVVRNKQGKGAKLGKRKEVHYTDTEIKRGSANTKCEGKSKILPLTGWETKYVVPDGWLYPLLGAFRVLLKWPKGHSGIVSWKTDPFKFFDNYGYELVSDIESQSEELGNNPNATGKSRMLWSSLRAKVENRFFRLEAEA